MRWIPEAARLLRPGGRLVFLTNSPLVDPLRPRRSGPATERLMRPQRGMYRVEWEDEDGVEFHLGHGEWIDLLHAAGFEVERLIELYAPDDAADARVLRHRDRRLGAEVAGRGAMGSAQARLILASTSPQRRRDPRAARDPVRGRRARPTSRTIRPTPSRPSSSARTRRARPARSTPTGQVTLGVDTAVVLDGRVYGKPTDRERRGTDARTSSPGGRTRSSPALCLLGADEDVVAHEITDVTFRLLVARRSSTTYLESGEWEGRAGAYAIQGLGGRLVERIEGDYLNVVGLPGALLVSLLEHHAPNLLQTRR